MTLDKNFTLPDDISSRGMQNTIRNEFDLSWHRGSNKRITTISQSELGTGVIDDKSVIYEFNSDFFRCEEFSSEVGRPHILFAGCSQTEGIGGNLETVWPTMFLNSSKLENKKLYNLARSGWGWQMIMDNVRVYINKYTKPDYLFILLPNVSRRFEYNTVNKDDYCYMQRYPNSPVVKEDIGDISSKEYFECLMNFVVGWRFFLDYCKSNEIKVLWSTWYFNEIENLRLLNMIDDNYVYLNIDDQIDYIAEKYQSGWQKTKHDLKKRDGHAGTLVNMYYADSFLKVAREKWDVF